MKRADLGKPPFRVVCYLPDMSGGGAERMQVELARYMRARGIDYSFLLDRAGGPLLDEATTVAPVQVLAANRQLAALPRLVRYLRQSPPDVLIVNMEHQAVTATIAKYLAGARTKIVVIQHIPLSYQVSRHSWKWRYLPLPYRAALIAASRVVAVSSGVAMDLTQITGFSRDRISVIHNGVIPTQPFGQHGDAPPHPWFQGGNSIIVGMGRLTALKGFDTLIRAFSLMPGTRERKLLILGEGEERERLIQLIQDLQLGDRVELPGFVDHPTGWLEKASLFVSASRFEGFGNVIVEALACGVPVVSTDCPHGPREILEDGRYGTLVPVGDPEAMAAAIASALASPKDREMLRARGRQFSVEASATQYMALLETLQ